MISENLEVILTPTISGVLQLSPIKVNEDYRKKWNIDLNDFVCLTRNGNLVSNSLYRIGGINNPRPEKDNYFMLLKYVEDFYPEHITKFTGTKDPKHLSGHWCIIDKNGIEKVVFDKFASPYLVKDSCIYSLNSSYYNIETKEFYGNSSNTMQSEEFLFLDNRYCSDKSMQGVMKINKKTGTWEVFK